MNRIYSFSAALLLPLAGCGGEPDSAAQVYEERADALEEAAAVSSPQGAARHEDRAETPAEVSGSNVMAPIPDNVSAGDR